MMQHNLLIAGHTKALSYAADDLRRRGCTVCNVPDSTVTHILLPVPSFESDGTIKGGGVLQDILAAAPPSAVVIGGNLSHPALAGYDTVNLLQDPLYLAENAAITAHCAVKIALNALPVTLQGCPVLVVGWGRIGKCLADLLRRLGARVCVFARKATDQAMLTALGYEVEDITPPAYGLMRYRVIFNTAPYPVISESSAANCRPECIKIDLASARGIAGEDVIWARGLPNKDAPESSGELIARSILRTILRKEQTL